MGNCFQSRSKVDHTLSSQQPFGNYSWCTLIGFFLCFYFQPHYMQYRGNAFEFRGRRYILVRNLGMVPNSGAESNMFFSFSFVKFISQCYLRVRIFPVVSSTDYAFAILTLLPAFRFLCCWLLAECYYMWMKCWKEIWYFGPLVELCWDIAVSSVVVQHLLVSEVLCLDGFQCRSRPHRPTYVLDDILL